LLRLERPASKIVVGNPSMADVGVQSGKVLVITGKVSAASAATRRRLGARVRARRVSPHPASARGA
jgi:Flp pilus assembly secretin CpaC